MNEISLELSLQMLNTFDDTEREIFEVNEAKKIAFFSIVKLNRDAIKTYINLPHKQN